MLSTLSASRLKRYKAIAGLLIKYGRSDLVRHAGLDDVLPAGPHPEGNAKGPTPEELAGDLERLGPVYVKLGQVLSSRADLLPPAYLQALSRLQDKLEPLPAEVATQVIEEELGVRISKAFAEFDPRPIATASLGQVHRARLRDDRPVVVKVQRPGVREQVSEEMAALADIAALVDKHTEVGRRYQFGDILQEFRETLAAELDYRREADHLERLHDDLRAFPSLVVPLPVRDYSTSRVLTMDYIPGKKITEVSRVVFTELDGTGLADELLRAYLKQILVDGFFHADPHPGNVLLTFDGRLALIDLGMVGYVSPNMQQKLLKLLIAVGEGSVDEAADTAIQMGQRLDDFDEDGFRGSVADLILPNRSATVANTRIGRAVLDFSSLGLDCGLRLPSELALLGKTLLNLDEIGRALDPDLNPNESIRRHAAELTRERFVRSLTPGNLVTTALDVKEFVDEFPGRLNRILDTIASNKLKLNVDAVEETTLIEGFQKVANRITTGLILAALIVGASMLMRVQTHFTLFGYPGLAMICFLVAAGGGFGLVANIVLHDRSAPKSQNHH